jgi:endonuclease YncB( thermonuclease family)
MNLNDLKKYNNIEHKNCVNFIPPIQYGKVIKVYDGDTITIGTILPYSETVYKFSVRIRNIDCPEIRSNDEKERLCASCAKQFLSGLILNTIVELKNVGYDKYGRILADIYLENNNIGDIMINEQLAVQYNGGKKEIVDWYKLYSENHKI